MGCSECGASCECLLFGGAGITISGSGNAGDPFVISAVGASTIFAATSSDNSIVATPAGTDGHTPDLRVRLSTVGQIPLVALSDGIAGAALPIDPTTPIPATWVNGVGLSVGPFPGDPVLGCGLISGAGIEVATSGTWGAGDLTFPDADTTGSPIYCDSAGQVRTIPPYGTIVAEEAQAVVGAASGTGVIAGSTGTAFILNNTSTNRTMVGMFTFSLGHFVTPGTDNASGFAVEEQVDSGAGYVRASQLQCSGADPATATVGWGWNTHPRTLSLAPGASQTVSRRVNVTTFSTMPTQNLLAIGQKTFMGTLT